MIKLKRPTAQKTVAKKTAATKKAAAPRAPARSRYDDDDEDTSPRGKAKTEEREAPAKHAPTRGGWGEADKKKESSFDTRFTQNLKIAAGEHAIIKFLEERPFAAVHVHWVEKKGRQSYLCPETEDCPLCKADVRADFEARFNVALLTETEPVLRSFVVKSRRYEELKAYNKAATGPLPRKWYDFSRTGSTMNDTRYKLELIRNKADIAEDYPDLYIPTPDDLEALELYTAEEVDAERPSMKELREVAADVLGGGYADDDD